MHNIVDDALARGGTCTGEHGIGLGKIDALVQEHGDLIPLMQAIKASFDPNGILNPGKVLPEAGRSTVSRPAVPPRRRHRRHVHRRRPARRRRLRAHREGAVDAGRLRPRRRRGRRRPARRAAASRATRSPASSTPRRSPRTRSSRGTARGRRSSRRRASATCSRCAACASRCSTTSSTRARRRSCRAGCGSRSTERIGPRGEVWTRARRGRRSRDVAEQIRQDDVEAVAIALLHSYADHAHERRVEEIVREAVGDERLRHLLVRDPARDPRVRAHEHGGRQRLRRAGDHALPRLARRPPARGRHRRAARDHAVERRHDDARDGAAQAGAPGRVRPRGRRDGLQLPRPRSRAAER